jgi:penicillin-binding protein 1A
VGYTGGFVTAVWVGKDDNTAMRGVTGGAAPAAIWKGFMEAALPRLNVQPIPNGPPMPEGWIAPDPVGDLIGEVEDPYGDSTLLPGGVDPNQGEPYDPGATVEQPRRNPAPVERPRRDDPPDQRPEPEARPEKEDSPLFF